MGAWVKLLNILNTILSSELMVMHHTWLWMDATLDNIWNIYIEILKSLLMIYIIAFLRISLGNNFKCGNEDTYYRIVYDSTNNWKQSKHY